jgi:tryptophan-rich sensory protein
MATPKPQWFRKCPRAPWQPPDFVFKFVWPILYTLYGIVLYQRWNQASIRNILLLGLALNLAWVPLYIVSTQLALVLIIVMTAIAGKTLQLLYNYDTLKGIKGFARSSTLFAPYPAWLLFALSLNAYLVWKC